MIILVSPAIGRIHGAIVAAIVPQLIGAIVAATVAAMIAPCVHYRQPVAATIASWSLV